MTIANDRLGHDTPANDPFASGLPRLESARTRLRALELRDAPALLPIYGDPEVARFGFAPPMATAEDALRLIAECHRLVEVRTCFHWGLALLEDDVIVGHATLFNLDTRNRRAEVGYSLRRDLWRRGIVSEALGVLLDFAFGVSEGRLDLRRLEADVDPRNEASLRVLEKAGFVREGFMPERWEKESGELEDTVFLGLLRRHRVSA